MVSLVRVPRKQTLRWRLAGRKFISICEKKGRKQDWAEGEVEKQCIFSGNLSQPMGSSEAGLILRIILAWEKSRAFITTISVIQ